MQVLKEFEFVGNLSKKRSRVTEENNYYWKKSLTDSQKLLLGLLDKTDWKDIELFQSYKKPKGIMKKIHWKLPSTKE